jgi:hypothetical protein
MNLSAITISKYENTFSMSNTESSLVEELELIKNGKYSAEILKCRSFVEEGNLEAYKAAKKTLPAITFSGTFNGPHKKDNLKTYSKLIVIDIDHIVNDISSIKRTLMDDEHVISAWVSPSGKGLKALLAIRSVPTDHKIAFDQILEYFKAKHQLDIDKTGSDLCRLCYISYDNGLHIKEKFKAFEVLPVEPTIVSKDKIIKAQPIFESSKEKKPNIAYNKRLFARLLKYLQTRKLSITTTYDDWYRVALAIANSFNPDIGKRYFLQLSALDDNYDEYKCLELLDYCYRHKREGAITFRTIVHMAKTHDFKE